MTPFFNGNWGEFEAVRERIQNAACPEGVDFVTPGVCCYVVRAIGIVDLADPPFHCREARATDARGKVAAVETQAIGREARRPAVLDGWGRGDPGIVGHYCEPCAAETGGADETFDPIHHAWKIGTA